jgi:hypothetical protein
MSYSKHVGPRSDAKTDVVGDRNHLIQAGMAFVIVQHIDPPMKDLPILHGALHLLDPLARRGLHLPIALFIPLDRQEKEGKSNGNSTS